LYPDTVEVLAFQLSAAECCTGATPVPERVTVAGDPLALLTIEILPFTVPVVVGLNWTAKMMFCDGVSVTGVVPPVIEYPVPLRVTCEIVMFAFPVFVMVTFCEAEDVPVVTFPKLRLDGLIPRVRVAAIPVPLRLTEVGEVAALLTIEIVPEAGPVEAGWKVTVIVA
jgi:hypothetical protein